MYRRRTIKFSLDGPDTVRVGGQLRDGHLVHLESEAQHAELRARRAAARGVHDGRLGEWVRLGTDRLRGRRVSDVEVEDRRERVDLVGGREILEAARREVERVALLERNGARELGLVVGVAEMHDLVEEATSTFRMYSTVHMCF